MSRPDQVSVSASAASVPASTPITAVDEYLAREQNFLDKRHDRADVVRSATGSPRMLVMQEFFKVFLSDASYGYEELSAGNYIKKNFLFKDTFDRFTNKYGDVAKIAKALLQAELSRSEYAVFIENLRASGVAIETAEEPGRMRDQMAEIDRALSEHRKSQEKIFVQAGIALSGDRGVDFDVLAPEARERYAALGERARARELFLAHCPELSDLIFASTKPAADDLWDASIHVPHEIKLYLNKACFPQEMIGMIKDFSESLTDSSSLSNKKNQLADKTSYFVAQAFSVLTLYIQSIMTSSPEVLSGFVQRFATAAPDSQDDQAKKSYVMTTIVQSFLVNCFGPLALESLMLNINAGPQNVGAGPETPFINLNAELLSYCSSAFNGIAAVIADIRVPGAYDVENNPCARLNYAIYLLSNINNPRFSPEDRENVARFTPFLQIREIMTTGSADIIKALINKAQSDQAEGGYSYIYKKLNTSVEIFDSKSYCAVVSQSKYYSAGVCQDDVSVLISKLGFNLEAATQQPCYVKTMAALYLSYATGSPNNEKVLEAVPSEKQLEVYQAIVEMTFACRGDQDGEIPDPQGVVNHLTNLVFKLNNSRLTGPSADESEPEKKGRQTHAINLIRLRLNEYIELKEVLYQGSAQEGFLALKPKQQAERNIAAAYQILALLEQLETYNATDASAAEKELAYNAVMNVVTDLVKQAEIRGYRLAEGQSSQFAKLLSFDIPHASAATTNGKKTILFPQGFDRGAFFDAIGEKHRSENKWYKLAFKKAGNWIRQNSFTTAVFVLSSVLITLAAAALTLALLSPALPVVLPLLGTIVASNLLLPAVIAGIVGLSVSLVSVIFNTQNTANAKIGYVGLGKLEYQVQPPAAQTSQSADQVRPSVTASTPLAGAAVALSEGTQTPRSVVAPPSPGRLRAYSESRGVRSRHHTPPTPSQKDDVVQTDAALPSSTVLTAPGIGGRVRGSSY